MVSDTIRRRTRWLEYCNLLLVSPPCRIVGLDLTHSGDRPLDVTLDL